MEPNSLLKDALSFFALGEKFTPDDLKKSFHELALKFHPDRGEFTSPVLFQELLKYHEVLETFSEIKIHSAGKIPQEHSDQEYTLYKKAKFIENEAILSYFKSRAGSGVRLNEENNPDLSVLRKKLEIAGQIFLEVTRNFPGGIWEKDSLDSIRRIRVWME